MNICKYCDNGFLQGEGIPVVQAIKFNVKSVKVHVIEYNNRMNKFIYLFYALRRSNFYFTYTVAGGQHLLR